MRERTDKGSQGSSDVRILDISLAFQPWTVPVDLCDSEASEWESDLDISTHSDYSCEVHEDDRALHELYRMSRLHQRYNAAEWERQRTTITRLYKEEGLKLDLVKRIMKQDHGFDAEQDEPLVSSIKKPT